MVVKGHASDMIQKRDGIRRIKEGREAFNTTPEEIERIITIS